MSGLRGVTLTVRFLCELAMPAPLAYGGFTVGDGVGAPPAPPCSDAVGPLLREPHHGRRTAWRAS